MDFLHGIVDADTNCVWAMRPSDQAFVMREYYDDNDALAAMLSELTMPVQGAVAEGAAKEFLRLLKASFDADLLPKATADARAEAFRALGELVSNWAYNHAQFHIDHHIDDHIDDLVASAEDDGSDHAYERARDDALWA